MIGSDEWAERQAGDNAVRESEELHPPGIERERIDDPWRHSVDGSQSLRTRIVRDEDDFTAVTNADPVSRTEPKTTRPFEHDTVCQALTPDLGRCTRAHVSGTGQGNTDHTQVDDSHLRDEQRLMNHELWDDDSGNPSLYFARIISHNCGGLQNYC